MIFPITYFRHDDWWQFYWSYSDLSQSILNVANLTITVNPYESSWHFRPLLKTFFAAEYALFGLNYHYYQFLNLAYLLINVLLLVELTSIVSKDRTTGYLAGISYLLLQNNTFWNIWWVGGGIPTLVTQIFLLSCLVSYGKSELNAHRGFYFLSLLCFILALLMRESSVALIVLLPPLSLILLKEKEIYKLVLNLVPFIIVTILFFVVRTYVKVHQVDSSSYFLCLRELELLSSAGASFIAKRAVIYSINLLSFPLVLAGFYYFNRKHIPRGVSAHVALAPLGYGAILLFALLGPLFFACWVSGIWFSAPGLGTALISGILLRKCLLINKPVLLSSSGGLCLLLVYFGYYKQLQKIEWSMWSTRSKDIVSTIESSLAKQSNTETVRVLGCDVNSRNSWSKIISSNLAFTSMLRLTTDNATLVGIEQDRYENLGEPPDNELRFCYVNNKLRPCKNCKPQNPDMRRVD